MKYFRSALLLIIFALFTGITVSQDLDPDTKKLLEKYQTDRQSMPKEVEALMPSIVKIEEKIWTVEPSTNMLLEAKIAGNNNYTSAANPLELNIIVNVFNVKNPLGKSTANSTLKQMRDGMLKNWKDGHPVEKNGPTTRHQYEKISVAKGYILMQKIFVAKHNEGEGSVPESTTFAALLYMELDNGALTAETNVSKDKKALEGMLKHTAANAVKINWDKYFK
jgi:hypothetical protein